MKKTLLVTLDFPPLVGGIAAYYSNICDHCNQESIVVLAPEIPGADSFDSLKKYKIYRRELLSKKFFAWPKWLPALRCIQEIIDKEKIQAVLIGQILPLGTAYMAKKSNARPPYFIFCHGMDISILEGRKKILAQRILQKSDGVFSNSNYTKHIVEKFGIPESKIFTVYPCPHIQTHPNEYDCIAMKNNMRLHNKKVLLTVGRLVERKGQDMVIQSLPKVLQKYNDVVYIIAGSGPDKKRLENIAKQNNCIHNVRFIENPTDAEISALYELCDIFIMPSRELKNGDVEGFGIVFLEANSYGKPVIGGKSGGISEAIQNDVTGILVDPLLKEEISRAILSLLDNPQYAHNLGMQGMDRVHHKFHWHDQVKIIQSVLQ